MKLELSQKDFGKRAGVHIQVISNIERGIAGIPAVRAKKFARVMNVSVELLVETAAKDFYEEYLRKFKSQC